jgi:hypothetical protein
LHHDLRLPWETAVQTGLAAHGVSIGALPEGAMASAFIEGATPEQFVEWATTTASTTANAAVPSAAASATPPRPMFPPVTPTTYHPPAQPAQAQSNAAKPVKPCATFVTLGVALHFAGTFLAGFGEGIGIFFGGEAYILLGGLIGITGFVLALIGVRRFLVAHDRMYATA